jgi:MFS family permease
MPRLHKDLWVLFTSMLLFAMAMSLYSVILPAYIRELGASAVELGLLGSIALALSTASALPGGFMADRFERRRVLLVGWAMCIPVPLIFAYATHWTGLIPGYFLLYFSMFCNSSVQSYIADRSTPENRSQAFTMVFATAYSLGMVFAPTAGGFMAEAWGINSVFWLSFVLYTASTAVMFTIGRSYPEVVTDKSQRFSLKVLPKSYWRYVALFSVGFFVTHLPHSFVTPFLQDVAGADLLLIGMLGSVTALGGVFLAPVLGKAADRLGVTRVMGIGFMVLAACYVLQVLNPVPVFLALVFFARGGASAVQSLMSSAISAVGAARAMGMSFAIYNLVTGLVGTVAPYTAGWLYARNVNAPFLLTALLATCLGVVLLVQKPPRSAPMVVSHIDAG